MNSNSIPSSASAIIIGGGVIGCSLAYHLAKIGWKDVVLLERKQLTSGTTWHAAGLVGQLRATMNMTRLAKYSSELFSNLEQETEIATGFRQNGSLGLALTTARLEEFNRGVSMARTFGLEAEILTPAECLKLYPMLNIEDVKGAVFLPKDGQADPTNIALALAKGARDLGVQIFEQQKVDNIVYKNGSVDAVEGDFGRIQCKYAALCTGMWSHTIGQKIGINIPLHAAEHFYIVTEPIKDLARDLPVLRIPDEWAYYKEDAGKILLGAFEPNAKPWGMEGISEDFCFDQLPEDLEHFGPVLEKAINRLPILAETGIATFFNGPESFTPDDRYLLGETPEVKNLFVATGFNSIGIQSSGGVGKVLAQWMDAGEPPIDLWDVDIRRMMPFQNNKRYLFERTKESLGLLYADHWPYRQFETARGIRRSPLHRELQDLGACFGETAGWERANWFLPNQAKHAGQKAEYQYSWGKQNWFDFAKQEHYAIRNNVGFFDLTSFAKFRVDGSHALALLQKLSCANVDVAPGQIVYTAWLNKRGCFEADLTISRLSETSFLVISAGAHATRDLAWMHRHIEPTWQCNIIDITSGESVIAVMGPNSRNLLQKLTSENLDNNHFPFGSFKQIDFGYAYARAHRISYVGELGWELYIPSEMAVSAFECLLEEGKPFGMLPCGMHVLDSCRLEKGFRHFGHDISDEDHLLEAGMGFLASKTKNSDYLGKSAVQEKRDKGINRTMMQFALQDPDALLYHNEPIIRDGKMVSYVTSGAYGHHLGSAVAMGYIPLQGSEKTANLMNSEYEIEIAGKRFLARASLKGLYDPENIKIKS